MAVGNRVFLKRNLPDNYLVEEFSKLPAANVADCITMMNGKSIMGSMIRHRKQMLPERRCYWNYLWRRKSILYLMIFCGQKRITR